MSSIYIRMEGKYACVVSQSLHKINTKRDTRKAKIARNQILLLLQYYKNFTRFVAQYDWIFQAFFDLFTCALYIMCVTFIL